MKRLVTSLTAFALVTPSVAFAAPAAQSLSLSHAAVQPVRAAAPMGKKMKAIDTTTAVVGGVLIAGGIACAIWCGGSHSDKPVVNPL